MLRKIRFLTDNDEGKQFTIPKGYDFFRDVCYAENGTPVIFKFNEPFIVKVGKRKFAEIIITKPIK